MAIPATPCALRVVFPCVLAVAASVPATDAGAMPSRTRHVSATAVCEAPLSVFDAPLRKRPVAIRNEGSSGIFISCAVPTDHAGDLATSEVRLLFASTVQQALNCTIVAGVGANLYREVKSVVVPAGGVASIHWTGIDKRGGEGAIALSCALPPGVEARTLSLHEVDADTSSL